MTHWAEKYIGQPYNRGDADCAHTLAQVRQEVFGLGVPSDIEVERKASRLGRLGKWLIWSLNMASALKTRKKRCRIDDV